MLGAGNAVVAGSEFRRSVRYRDTVLSLSPIAYWRLGESSGTNAVDETGTTDGTYVNTPTLGETSLLANDVDTATTFTAANSEYMVALNQSVFNISNIAISVIVQISSYPASESEIVSVAEAYNSTTTDKALRLQTNGLVKFYTFDGTQDFALSGTAIPLDEPVHIVGTIDGAGTSRIYVNGVHKGSIATSSSYTGFTTASILVGGKTSTTAHLNGTIDEVAVFSGGLTATEVLSIYNANS